jgi:hypothetical protein
MIKRKSRSGSQHNWFQNTPELQISVSNLGYIFLNAPLISSDINVNLPPCVRGGGLSFFTACPHKHIRGSVRPGTILPATFTVVPSATGKLYVSVRKKRFEKRPTDFRDVWSEEVLLQFVDTFHFQLQSDNSSILCVSVRKSARIYRVLKCLEIKL